MVGLVELQGQRGVGCAVGAFVLQRRAGRAGGLPESQGSAGRGQRHHGTCRVTQECGPSWVQGGAQVFCYQMTGDEGEC